MEQPLIKKNIHKYMKLKGYRYYLDLLYEIAKKLNKSSSEAKTFVIKVSVKKSVNLISPSAELTSQRKENFLFYVF